MKRFILPSLCVALLAGCNAAEHPPVKTASAVAPKANVVAAPMAVPPVVRPATPPPELPAPVLGVVRLAQTTLGEGVLVDYVATLKEPYSLNADQVIYLRDLGLSDTVIQTLLKHQQANPVTEVATAAPSTEAASPAATAPVIRSVAPSTITSIALPEPESAAPPAPAQAAPVAMVQPATQVTYNTFYETLNPYGSWIDLPDYGRCWQPTVAVVNPGWRPYCDEGNWVWSDSGWYWRSQYSWGWAPFHYGRWQLAAGHGWCWAPDTCWGPAWVTWRSSGSHCGWSPLPPGSGWSVGVGLTWHGGRAALDCDFGLGVGSFVYLGWNNFCDPRPWRHSLSRSEAVAVHQQTRSVNDIHGGSGVNIIGNNNTVVINNGPGLAPVQQHTRSEISKVNLVDSPDVSHALGAHSAGKPGSVAGATLPVYRPNPTMLTASARTGSAGSSIARPEPVGFRTPANSPANPTRRSEVSSVPARTEIPSSRGSTANYNSVSSPRSEPRPASGVVTGGSREAVASPTIIRRPSASTPVSTISSRPTPTVAAAQERLPGNSGYSSVRPTPSGSSGFTANPGVSSGPISRGEAPKPAAVVPTQGGDRSRIDTVRPTPSQPIPSGPRPAPNYTATPAPAYRAEATRPTPAYRAEPVRTYSPPSGPAQSAPARVSQGPSSYSPPVQNGGSGGNGGTSVPQRSSNRQPQ